MCDANDQQKKMRPIEIRHTRTQSHIEEQNKKKKWSLAIARGKAAPYLVIHTHFGAYKKRINETWISLYPSSNYM